MSNEAARLMQNRTALEIDSQGHEEEEEEDNSSGAADNMKSIIFGGTDGVFHSLSLVAAAAGADLSSQTVVVLGFATVAAGAVAMGTGEYLSSKAHKEFAQAEKRRRQWEFKHDRVGRKNEVVKLFELRGMGRNDAELVVEKMSQYENFFINLLVTEELGSPPPDDDELTLMSDACVMSLSYAGFGAIPLLTYCLGGASIYVSKDVSSLRAASAMITGLTLFGLGGAKSTFSSSPWFYSGFEAVVFGGVCAVVAYSTGSFFGLAGS